VQEVLLSEATRGEGRRVLARHLRSAPPGRLPDTTVAELVDALLSPVRSGILVTRSDLVHAAQILLVQGSLRETGMVLRMGERRFVLRAMLNQDPAATLGWLTNLAHAEGQRHLELHRDLGEIASFWTDRADATASSLARSLDVLKYAESGT